MIVLVMGVSGAGKSTIGARLARRLGLRFIEGDDFHDEECRRRMAAGIPLTDADRWPWLDRLRSALAECDGAVLACSALKESYRGHLLTGQDGPCRIIWLTAPAQVIAGRLAARSGHFMPAGLLDSQLAALEPPTNAAVIDVSGPPDAVESAALAALARQP